MSERAICTIVDGAFDEIFAATAPAMRDYADKCNADFIIHRADTPDPRWGPSPQFAKYELFSNMADRAYERVLYLDADIYCRKTAPDIFDEYKFTAARLEHPHPRPHKIAEAVTWIRQNIWPAWPHGRYYNTGVLLFDDVALMKLARKLAYIQPKKSMYFEQCQLNWLLCEVGMPAQHLGIDWNAPIGDSWHGIIPDYRRVHFLHGNAVKWEDKLSKLKAMIEKFP